MVPTIETQIFNMALDILSQKAVNDIGSGAKTEIEQVGKRWYVPTRRTTLMSYNPNFANFGRAISRTGASENKQFPDKYGFPNDYLKLTAIEDPRVPLQNWKYSLQGLDIHLDNGGAASLNVFYIADIEDISLYPADFTRLLVGELAVAVAPAITKVASFKAEAKAFRDEARLRVLGSNGQMKPPIRYERGRITRTPTTSDGVAGPYKFLFEPN